MYIIGPVFAFNLTFRFKAAVKVAFHKTLISNVEDSAEDRLPNVPYQEANVCKMTPKYSRYAAVTKGATFREFDAENEG